MQHTVSSVIRFWLFSLLLCFGIVHAQQTNISTLKDSLIIAQNDDDKSNLYNKIIKYYADISNDSCVYYAKEGLKLFTAHHYKRGQAWMIYALANDDDTHGNSTSAKQQALFSYKLFSQTNDARGIAKVDNLLGIIEGKKGFYDTSIQYFLAAKRINDSIGDKEGIFTSYINFGLVYDFMNDTDRALIYYLKADSISKLLPNSEITVTANLDLGSYFFERKDTASAFHYLNNALEICGTGKYYPLQVATLMNLSDIMISLGNVGMGKQYLDNALAVANKYNLPDLEADILLNYEMSLPDIKFDTAIQNLNKALTIVQKSGNKYSERSVYKAFTVVYEKAKRFEEANKYLKLAHALSDSLLNVNKAKEVANLTSVYELQESNAKINNLEAVYNRINKQNTIIIVFAILLLIACGVLLYSYTQIKRLNKNMQARKQELLELNQMKDKIFSIIGHDMRGPISNIATILDIVQNEVELPEEYMEILATLKDHSIATLETLDTLMQLGKSLMKGRNYNPKNFDAKIELSKSIGLKAFAAKKKDITIHDNTPENMMVYGESGHFDFIARNLISNAIKFSFIGGKVFIDAQRQSDGYILFSVKDQGTGINTATLPHIFKATVTSTYGTKNEKGNGIGLMLCDEFIKLNSGKIWVESKEGEGAIFYFTMKEGLAETQS